MGMGFKVLVWGESGEGKKSQDVIKGCFPSDFTVKAFAARALTHGQLPG